MSISTFFPQASREELVRLADPLGAWRPDQDRAIVNLLRHQYTDYEAEPTRERHKEACRAIAAQYPWLAAECERQISRRAQNEWEAEAAYQMVLEQKKEDRERRQALIEASRDIISSGALRIGQRVLYRHGNRTYEATIINVGRSRVTITYHLKTSGAERTKQVYAALVEPVEGEQR